MKHIPGLDGLRALAVLVVFATHTGVQRLGWGWLGVDVFFVLSGYLITRLLLHEHDQSDSVSLGRFYARRAARLYPALLLMIAGVLVAAIFLDIWSELGWDRVLSATFYLTDLWAAVTREGGMLTHTWSLAVEEQFYLLWPLLFLALRTRRNIMMAAGVLGLASFAAMLAAGGIDGHLYLDWNYVTPWTRAWELLMGCALAAWRPRIAKPDLVVAGSAVAIAFVVLTAPLLSFISAWHVLIVCLATAAFLATADHRTWATSALEVSPLKWLGVRSYGFYLFHAPIIATVDNYGMRRAEIIALSFVLTILACAASYALVERPVRRAVHQRTSPRVIVLA